MDPLDFTFHFRDVLPRVRSLLLHTLEFLLLLIAGYDAPCFVSITGDTPIRHQQQIPLFHGKFRGLFSDPLQGLRRHSGGTAPRP